MKAKSIIAIAAFTLAATAVYADPYRVVVPLGADADGAMAKLVNFDSGATLDSVLVTDGVATFSGEIDEPILGRVLCDGGRLPVFILESGTVSFSKDNEPFGTMLNDQLRELGKQIMEIRSAFGATQDPAEQEKIYGRYNALMDSMTTANSDNALGYYIFLNGDASTMSAPELRAEFAKNPYFGSMERAKQMLQVAERREATGVGGKMIDFEVTYDGKTSKLSDYVGKGKYVLVDFWASWCGPCMRQVPVLKEIQAEYKDRLDILGVAVWDEPDATKQAIESHGISWDCILNAQTIPTELYGISGIPCIILFGPDGTILSRDKQGDELKADVAAALSK